jgi:hypothetical protein
MDVVHPGWVVSETDGDRHFVGYVQLCRLYGLNPRTAVDGRLPRWDYPPDAKHYHPQRHYKDYRQDR